jgi:hypothetical protein
MTYALARAQLVAIVEGSSATALQGGSTPRFHEAAAADDRNPPGVRAFSLFALADDVRVPLLSRARRHRVARMELSVFYRHMADRKSLDLMLRSDHQVVGDRLIDPSLWQSASSGIISIEQAAGALILHADVERRGDLIVHAYRFDLEYRSGDL